MIDHIIWALTVVVVAAAFLHLGWVLHRDRYRMHFPRRPRRPPGKGVRRR